MDIWIYLSGESVNQPTAMSVDISEIGIISLVGRWLRIKQIVFLFQVFQHRKERIQYDTFKIVRDLIHFDFIDILVFNLFHDKILCSGMNRFALSDYMGFLRHGWPPVHMIKVVGGRKTSLTI